MKKLPRGLISVGAALVAANTLSAAPATIKVDAGQPGHAVSPMLWGLFFEDINLSADGGLYAELVRNRSFEDSDDPTHWAVVESGGAAASATVTCERPFAEDPLNTRNKRPLRLTVSKGGGQATAGVSNSGYWGIPVNQGGEYRLTLAARRGEGEDLPLTVTLESKDGKRYASGGLTISSTAWATRELRLTSTATDPDARLVIRTGTPGILWLDTVSLFPTATWQARPNGLRPDLAQMLENLKPAFLRFPGGCWVEGETMRESYRWKETVGPLHERRTQWNIWGYWATHGLGYHEYSLKARKLGGSEGFLVLFNVRDADSKSWWNLGGWGNSRHAVEIGGGEAGATGGRIENNRWYDIRIETAGGRIKCFLDGRPVHDVPPLTTPSLFASATTDQAAGEIIPKLVNGNHQPQPVEIQIGGARIADGPAVSAVVLTSDHAMDENSLDQPERVSPKPASVIISGGSIRHNLNANSFTVIRLNKPPDPCSTLTSATASAGWPRQSVHRPATAPA